MRRGFILTQAVLLLGMLSRPASALDAPIALGVEGSWASLDEFGLGARLAVGLNRRQSFELVGDYVWYLPITILDTERFVWEVNAGLSYNFTFEDETVRPYIGAGFHASHAREEQETDDMDIVTILDQTRYGANLIAGMRFGRGMHGLFLETRIEIGGGENMVFTAGLRF